MRKSVNRSELIRELHTKNPSLSVAEIIAQMKKDGNPVSAPLVYQTLRKISKGSKAPRKKPGRKPKAVTASVPATKSFDDLYATMQNFVNTAGGLDKAIEILNVFKR
jgi:hypothetical protein